VGSPVVKDVVEDLEEYLENVDDLKSSTTSSLKRCRWFQIIDMLNNRQISPNRNCSTLAIPWCFYEISRAFDGFSTSIIWQKYHPPELKHQPISRLLKRCWWFQIPNMLNNRQISPKRNCSTVAIPWCFYKMSRAFDGFSTSIIWQKYQARELKNRPIFLLLCGHNYWRKDHLANWLF